MKNIFFIFFAFSIILFGFAEPAKALTIGTHQALALDTSISREDTSFNLPEEIILVPIFQNAEETLMPTKERFRGLYYYTIQKLGFSDLPFHYVVGEDGSVFAGNSGGDERQIAIEGIGNKIVVVGYMAKSSANSFSKKSLTPLKDLLLQISNKNSINPEKIRIKGINFKRDPVAKSVSMSSKDVFGTWNADLATMISSIKPLYNPANRNYQIKVEEIVLPTAEVEPGTIVSGKVKITNLNSSGLYAGTNSEIIANRLDNASSAFYINYVWLSQSEASIMKDGDVLLPLKTQEFEFSLSVPLVVGEYSEKFNFKTLAGDIISSDIMTIKVLVKKTDKKILEILDTGSGILNVRSEPSSVANVISNVSVGQRFFFLEDAGNGWFKIDLGGAKSGWVASWYTKEVN